MNISEYDFKKSHLIWTLSRMRRRRKWFRRIFFGNYVFVKPELWVDESLKVIYVVNPKCACTAIKTSLLEHENRQSELNLKNTQHVHHLADKFIRRHAPKDLTDYFVFTFVRNPTERVASVYRNKFRDSHKILENGFEFEDYLGGIFSINSTWEEFAFWVSIIPDRLAEKHFVSQKFYLENAIGLTNIDFIGKLENLTEDWGTIQKKFGYPDLKKVNSSSNVSESFPCDPILRNRFEKDFQEFGYSG